MSTSNDIKIASTQNPVADLIRNRWSARSFSEKQIYRIDHYLGKETVQNLMVLRFANNLFERAWDSEHIDNIQITVSESLGVEKRAAYYDNSGALLDMIQNHLLQLLCLVAMEPPHLLEADEVRNEKLKVLRALRPISKKNIASICPILRFHFLIFLAVSSETSPFPDVLSNKSFDLISLNGSKRFLSLASIAFLIASLIILVKLISLRYHVKNYCFVILSDHLHLEINQNVIKIPQNLEYFHQ